MSYLYRNGTGRNNILYGGNNTTSLNYLRRTGTSRNSIQWYTISSNGTYNILERYNTSRNSIRWNNIVFSFGNIDKYTNIDNIFVTDLTSETYDKDSPYKYLIMKYEIRSFLSNGYTLNRIGQYGVMPYHKNASSLFICNNTQYNSLSGLFNYIKNTYTKITFKMSNNTQYIKTINEYDTNISWSDSLSNVALRYTVTSGTGINTGNNMSIYHTQITFS